MFNFKIILIADLKTQFENDSHVEIDQINADFIQDLSSRTVKAHNVKVWRI